MKKIVFVALFALLFASCGNGHKVDNTPVTSLDLQRYLGVGQHSR